MSKYLQILWQRQIEAASWTLFWVKSELVRQSDAVQGWFPCFQIRLSDCRVYKGSLWKIHEIKSSQSDFDQTLLRRTSCNDDKSGEKLSSKISGTLERSSSTDRVERKYLDSGEKLSAGFVKVPPCAHLFNLVTSTATEEYIFWCLRIKFLQIYFSSYRNISYFF